MNRASRDEVITLRGGHVVSLAALRLGWRLEERGIEMRVDGDVLVLRPRDLVRADEVSQLRRYRHEIIQLLAYCDEVRA